MARKLMDVNSQDGNKRVAFKCPGCDLLKVVCVEGTPKNEHVWGFNGDYEKPTFTPSLLWKYPDGSFVCHSFVRDGKIEFLGDCTHEKKSSTHDLLDVENKTFGYGDR